MWRANRAPAGLGKRERERERERCAELRLAAFAWSYIYIYIGLYVALDPFWCCVVCLAIFRRFFSAGRKSRADGHARRAWQWERWGGDEEWEREEPRCWFARKRERKTGSWFAFLGCGSVARCICSYISLFHEGEEREAFLVKIWI